MILSEIRDGTRFQKTVCDIAFEANYDVIVCGLGTAGSLAAILSAENGLKVLGIEHFTCVGGTTTIGGIEGHYFGVPGGRYETIDTAVSDFQRKYTCTKLESRKFVLEEFLSRNHVDILYESSICGVYLQNNAVVGIKAYTPDGIKNYACLVFMDCTADAYIADMAGCETEFGRDLDGLTQPYSMVSLIYNGKRYCTTNFDFGRVDQRDDAELSQALIYSRTAGTDLSDSTSQLISQMPLIGVREGRRIVAEESVKLADVLANRQTAEPMFFSYADLDKHGWDIAFDGSALGDWAIGANLGAYNVTVAVPWKVIIPKKIDGILVPCRALGVDRDVASCVRMVLDMKKVAEAAAEIATLAVKYSCKLRMIPYEELRKTLTESGCLDFSKNFGLCIDGIRDSGGKLLPKESVQFITAAEQLDAHLETLKPGIAIWSAKQLGEAAVPTLKVLLHSKNESTRKHAAFALATTGNRDCISVLQEMVIERDGCMLQDCRKHNNQRGCIAIYLLGRLEDAEITDALIEIITDKMEITRSAYHQPFSMQTRYAVPDFENEYFQFVSNAVVALIRIADAHPNLRKKIAYGFEDAFGDDTYYHRFTTRDKRSSEGSMVTNIKNVAFAAVKRWGISPNDTQIS